MSIEYKCHNQNPTQAKCGDIFVNVDDFDRQAIRRVVHGFYERHEYPTLKSLLAELKSSELFGGGRSTLHQLLKEVGFPIPQASKQKVHIRAASYHRVATCLSSAREPSKHPRPTIFLDETWCNSRHGRTHMGGQ